MFFHEIYVKEGEGFSKMLPLAKGLNVVVGVCENDNDRQKRTIISTL